MSVYRPIGVKALVILFLIVSVLGLTSGTLIAATSNYDTVWYFLILILQTYVPYIESGILIYLYTIIFTNLSLTYYTPLIGLIIQIVSGSYLITSVGLWYMKRWGYLLGLIIGIIHIVGGISGILFGFMLVAGLLVLIFGLVIFVYLRRSGVKDEFE